MTWYITGNSNIDATRFLGTLNNQPLIIKTNQLADNSEKMRINPDGNVGIAKAPSTTYKLDVAGTINATEIHKNGVPLGGTASQWDDVSGGINFDGGNVGIGATNPHAGLEISKGSTNDLALLLSSSGAGWGSGVQFRNTAQGGKTFGIYSGWGSLHFADVDNGVDRLIIGSAGGVRVPGGRLRVSESDGPQTSGVLELSNATKTNYVFTDGPSGHLHTRTDSAAHHVLLQTGGTQGNVSIGTANPQAKLHISSAEPQFRLESTGDRALVQLAKGGAPQWDFGVGQSAGNNDFWFGDMVTYRMVLQKGTGNVGIGTLNPRQRLDVDGNIRWGNNWLGLDQGGSIELGGDNSTPGVGVPYIDFHFRGLTQDFNTRIINDDNGRLSIVGNLNVTGGATKPGGGWWAATSDIRLKKSVQSLKGALEKLLRLRGVSFEWKKPEEQGNLTGTQMGLVAQEVEEVFPEWISTDPDGYRILTIRGFEALAVEAFKQLKAENEELRARIEALEPA